MRHAKRGFTLVEIIVVIAIIAILATIGMVGYREMSTRAKNASIVHSIKNTVKAIELYQKKYGTYPLRQYTNEKFFSATWNKEGTDTISTVSLILNDPSAIKTLQKHAAGTGRLTSRVTQNDHSGEDNYSYRLRKAYLSWYPQYLDTVSRSTVSRGGEQKIRGGSTSEAEWSAYADYLAKLFNGISLPVIYNESSSNFRAVEPDGSISETILMGAEYSLTYGTERGRATAFLTYVLAGKASCQSAGVQLHKQKYLADSNATLCSLKIGEEQAKINDRGDD